MKSLWVLMLVVALVPVSLAQDDPGGVQVVVEDVEGVDNSLDLLVKGLQPPQWAVEGDEMTRYTLYVVPEVVEWPVCNYGDLGSFHIWRRQIHLSLRFMEGEDEIANQHFDGVEPDPCPDSMNTFAGSRTDYFTPVYGNIFRWLREQELPGVARYRLLALLGGHNVTGAALNGDYAVTASGFYNTLKLWDLTSGAEIWEVSIPNQVDRVIFSPDGDYIVAYNDYLMQVYAAANGDLVTEIRPRMPLTTIDNERIVTGEDDFYLLWSLETGELAMELFTEVILDQVALLPDSLIGLGEQGGIRFDLETGAAVPPRYVVPDAEMSGLALSSEGLVVASDRGIHVLDLATGDLLRTVTDKPVIDVAVAGNVVAGSNGDLALWDLETNEELNHFAGLGDYVAFDGERAVTLADRVAWVWDLTGDH